MKTKTKNVELCPNSIVHLKEVSRSIENFNIYKYDSVPMDVNYSSFKEEPISVIGINCEERVIYKNRIEDDKLYVDTIKVDVEILAYRSDGIELSIIGEHQEQTKISWSPYLEERFEALYFEGLL